MYVYDAWGDLLQKSVTKCSAENLNLSVGVNNRISTAGYAYDAAGNMTSNATDGVTATYDAESRIATALKGGVTTAYVYDSDGNRVKKFTPPPPASNPTGTLYWYMTPGIVAESDLSGATKSEYVFFNGERVARRDGVNGAGGVFYYFSDHLKTASVITDASGTIKAESDYYPWGGELQFVNADSNHYKFTGKERDTETGLDYFGARYYSNGLGRWVSADWSATPIPVPYADFYDPQTLNLYQYVGGNPASKTDSLGHACDGPALFCPVLPSKLGDVVRAAGDALDKAVDTAADFLNFAIHEYQPHVPGVPPPQGGCVCPPQNGQDNKKENDNNSKSENTGGEKSGSAKGGTSKETGSYTNTHESGKTYSGKGGRARSQASGQRVEKQTGDKHTATDWKRSTDGREAFKDESRRIDANGGAKSRSNYNQRESPGKNYRKQDGSN